MASFYEKNNLSSNKQDLIIHLKYSHKNNSNVFNSVRVSKNTQKNILILAPPLRFFINESLEISWLHNPKSLGLFYGHTELLFHGTIVLVLGEV